MDDMDDIDPTVDGPPRAGDLDRRIAARRIYGRGFFDGLRASGVAEPEIFMLERKMMRAVSALNGMARAVYDAMEPGADMQLHDIARVLAGSGRNPDRRVIEGCLGRMVESGLVVTGAGRRGFERVAPRCVPAVDRDDDDVQHQPPILTCAPPDERENHAPPNGSYGPDKIEVPHAQAQVHAAPASIIDRFAAIAASLRGLARECERIASEIDDAALDAESRAQRTAGTAEQLRRLREIVAAMDDGGEQ